MASPAMLLDLTLNDLEGKNLDLTNFSPSYVWSGQTYTYGFIEKVLGPHM